MRRSLSSESLYTCKTGEMCPSTEETVATGEVINQLLHHVGAMCIHQLNLLAASSNSLPLGALLGKQHPMEARHFSSICDIMEKAMVNGDTCIIRCILVVFQVSFRGWVRVSWVAWWAPPSVCDVCAAPQVVFRFSSPQSEQNRESVRRAGLLLWQLLMAPVDHIGSEIQREVCLAIRSVLFTPMDNISEDDTSSLSSPLFVCVF